MITINNNLEHSQKAKDYFVKKTLKKYGYPANVKNNIITLNKKISDDDLNELKFVFNEYQIINKK